VRNIKIINMVLSRSQAEVLLAIVILSRSISYVITKVGLQDMGVFTLLGVRFLTAFIVLLPFGWKRLRSIPNRILLRGMLLGASFFAIMVAEVSGLKTTEASTAAFLENTAIIFVPLFEAVLRRKFPRIPIIISAAISLGGVALLTLDNGYFSLSRGELLCLLAAVFYACSLILTDRISKQDDPLTLGILQVGFMGVYSMIFAFIFEIPKIPTTATEWGVILALAVICSSFGFTLQPLAQSYTTSERAGLFCALGPVGATISGSIFLNEKLGFTGILGTILILFGMILINICDRLFGRGKVLYEIRKDDSKINA
jgi:drug/metabolite transporter (DMT)-like permease